MPVATKVDATLETPEVSNGICFPRAKAVMIDATCASSVARANETDLTVNCGAIGSALDEKLDN